MKLHITPQAVLGVALLTFTLVTPTTHALSFDSFLNVFTNNSSSTQEVRGDASLRANTTHDSNVNGQVNASQSVSSEDADDYNMLGATTSSAANVDAHTNALFGMYATTSDDGGDVEASTSFFASLKTWLMSLFTFSSSVDAEATVTR